MIFPSCKSSLDSDTHDHILVICVHFLWVSWVQGLSLSLLSHPGKELAQPSSNSGSKASCVTTDISLTSTGLRFIIWKLPLMLSVPRDVRTKWDSALKVLFRNQLPQYPLQSNPEPRAQEAPKIAEIVCGSHTGSKMRPWLWKRALCPSISSFSWGLWLVLRSSSIPSDPHLGPHSCITTTWS